MLVAFPGQGAQKVQMGKDIYDAFPCARDVFHMVDDAISFDLTNLIFNGSEDDLKKTENTQPAMMAVSMAFVETLRKEFNIDINKLANFFAGHSLGEYTALCAAGSISIADTAKLLRARGIAMANASNNGVMAAIIGLDIQQVEKITKESSIIDNIAQIANDNSVGQIVISGHKEAVTKAMHQAKESGAKLAILLEVSGAFHSKLMNKAADELKIILEKIKFDKPAHPIIDNVTANAENTNFQKLLLQQLTERVRWTESMLFAATHVDTLLEIGYGKVLTGLAKRICPDMKMININSLKSLEAFAADYS